MSEEKKEDFIEMEFEFGNIEFEARGKSDVVERMFQLLIEKIETGGLVATLELPEEDEWEDQDWEEDEDWEEEDDEEEGEYEYEEDSYEYEEEEETTDLDEEGMEDDFNDDDEEIPREAYLDPPPDWDSLDEETPPMSEAEKESKELDRDY